MSMSSLGGGPSRLKTSQMKRHSAFDEFEDEEHVHHANRNGVSAGRWKEEALSGFSAREDERRKRDKGTQKQQLVIQKQADANWMEERKKRLGLEKYRKELGSLSGGFGGGNRDSSASHPTTERVGDEEQKIGLEVRHKSENGDDDRMQTDHEEENKPSMEMQPVNTQITDEDTEARAALLSGKSNNIQHENVIINPISEEEALIRDMDSRPDAPSLSDYANMPVDDFGAALLRGMGWKEGMGAGKQRQGPTSAPLIKKRAALLGLGAKEREPVEDREDKKSSRSSHRSSHKPERRYVPVTRKEREEEEGERESHSRSTRERKRSYSPPTSRNSRYEEDRERSRHRDESKRDRDRHEDRYSSDRKRSDRDYDKRRESERRDAHSRRDHKDRHRSDR